MKNILALFSGSIFGLGLTISSMTNPDKVLGFLDLFNNWDPSLAFVMGGAIIITAPMLFVLTKNKNLILSKEIYLPILMFLILMVVSLLIKKKFFND